MVIFGLKMEYHYKRVQICSFAMKHTDSKQRCCNDSFTLLKCAMVLIHIRLYITPNSDRKWMRFCIQYQYPAQLNGHPDLACFFFCWIERQTRKVHTNYNTQVLKTALIMQIFHTNQVRHQCICTLVSVDISSKEKQFNTNFTETDRVRVQYISTLIL